MIRSILIPDDEALESAEDVIRRGNGAKALLSDPSLAFAMREAERDALLEWHASADATRREQIHAELQYSDRLVRMLVAMVNDAEVLEHIREQEDVGPS